MKIISDMRLFSVGIFLCACFFVQAQVKQIPLPLQGKSKKNHAAARTQAVTSMQLPFWDDFSFNNSPFDFANDSLWQYGTSVWVNTGMGINPPTLKVATFDGLDSTRLPYNINIPLAKGVADKLFSRPIRMDLVAPSDSIFIFFYYQYQGNGEPPDSGDEFSLWFKSDSSTWDKIWAVQVDSTSNRSKFIPVKISIKDPKYFHNSFQFRFQNFARLSGPFDTWNLDYVYINNGKPQYAPVYADLPDRAITAPFASVFKQYHSLPVRHLLSKGDSALVYGSITATSQRQDQTEKPLFNPQPVRLTVDLTTTVRLNKAISSNTILFDTLHANVFYDSTYVFAFDSLLSLKNIDPRTDSIGLQFFAKLTTGDNDPKTKKMVTDSAGTHLVDVGDYDTIVYKGLEFRYNDTISTKFKLTNYYAYDDGIAEYAITLTQPGSYLAYQFDMVYAQPDTLIAVDIYFPHVGDESDQVLQLMVYNEYMKGLDSLNITVNRTTNNTFTRYPLDQAVLVNKKFFIGYKQNSTANIGIGFDKNSDSGDKLFYNVTGVWQPNTDLHGNAMIRPVFGHGVVKTITAIESEKKFAYPNPNTGMFFLPQQIDQLQVVDITGKNISFVREDFSDKTQVTLRGHSAGVYLARYFCNKQWRTEKIMIIP
ncbi:MAG: T9SS type A sorting domain-containing protein [Bacteroidetes bacterium]|nr:T9SS type A sorting domain-containing protein [Bacteroidota bacterium]